MDVFLPQTGCNIINSATTFYNYSPDGRTRTSYVIYDGKALVQSVNTNQYGYTYTGDCLTTGDLVYKPELTIYNQFFAFTICIFVFYLIYHIIFKRLLP